MADRIPENFSRQVKDALEHLYDHAHLQNHPLVTHFGMVSENALESTGLRLRRELVAAIETFNPGEGVPFIAPHARLYNVLVMHYVERVTIQEIAYQLSLSTRQVQRNLRQGEENIIAWLWERQQQTRPENAKAQSSSFQDEIAHLGSHPQKVDLYQLYQRAAASVEPLANQRGVSIQSNLESQRAWVTAEPVIAGQALVSIVSRVVSLSRSGPILLEVIPTESDITIRFLFQLKEDSQEKNIPGKTVLQLTEQLGWNISIEVLTEGKYQWDVRILMESPSVLIIDDNQGLVSLMERYLGESKLKVLSAANGKAGLSLAKELLPDVIFLDVMMPEMSGWEVLQWLLNDPQTASIPVVICSVINEPDLALALGAAAIISKPVRQEDVLKILNQLRIIG